MGNNHWRFSFSRVSIRNVIPNYFLPYGQQLKFHNWVYSYCTTIWENLSVWFPKYTSPYTVKVNFFINLDRDQPSIHLFFLWHSYQPYLNRNYTIIVLNRRLNACGDESVGLRLCSINYLAILVSFYSNNMVSNLSAPKKYMMIFFNIHMKSKRTFWNCPN